METKTESRALSAISADVLVIGIYQDEDVSKALKSPDPFLSVEWLTTIATECKKDAFGGKSGQSLCLPSYGSIAARKVMLRGLGKKSEVTESTIRKMSAAARRASPRCEAAAIILREGAGIEHVQAAVEGFILGGYKFTKYKSNDDDKVPTAVKTLYVVAPDLTAKQTKQAIEQGVCIAEATNFARDLIAEPASFMTPTRLASIATELNSDDLVTVEVLGAKELEKLKMGAFLGVARGAKEPAKFIIMRYKHKAAKRTIGLAGKGITFDSGGLSIKSAQNMENMKYDMSGAAAVIATIKAIQKLNVPVNVIAVAAATENMPGEDALHPGDVLTAMNGKTIEVNNTDAEGRLILADALTFLSKEQPDCIIDLATLTGAVVTALGNAAAGIMGNDDDLVNRVIESGGRAGEKYWQLPLFDEYKDSLKSEIADLKNAGARGQAPTSAAGMFLKEFVNGVPWAHLDIAGPAWLDKDNDEVNKGGTAFGVRTLCYFLLNESSQ